MQTSEARYQPIEWEVKCQEPEESGAMVTIVTMVALSEEFDVIRSNFEIVGDESTDRFIRLVLDIGTPGYHNSAT